MLRPFLFPMRFSPDTPPPVPNPDPPKRKCKVVVVDVKKIAAEVLAQEAKAPRSALGKAFAAVPDATLRFLYPAFTDTTRAEFLAWAAERGRCHETDWRWPWHGFVEARSGGARPLPAPRLVKQDNGGFKISYTPKDTLVAVPSAPDPSPPSPPSRDPAKSHPWAVRLRGKSNFDRLKPAA